MYLTDYREYCLKDVITQLEPKLFKKVTGLEVQDFNLLCELNVFNAPLMNDAVYKFKRYEDSSLVYTGLESKHSGERVGLFDTVLSQEEYATLYSSQQSSMSGIGYDNSELPSPPKASAINDKEQEESEEEPPTEELNKAEKPDKEPSIHKSTSKSLIHKAVSNTLPHDDKKTVIDKVVTGCRLVHKSFGVGIVKNIDHQYITVDFRGVDRRFLYPAAILQGFLKLE